MFFCFLCLFEDLARSLACPAGRRFWVICFVFSLQPRGVRVLACSVCTPIRKYIHTNTGGSFFFKSASPWYVFVWRCCVSSIAMFIVEICRKDCWNFGCEGLGDVKEKREILMGGGRFGVPRRCPLFLARNAR